MTLSVFSLVIIHDLVIVVSFTAAVWAHHASHSLPKRRAQMTVATETIVVGESDNYYSGFTMLQ